MMGRITNVSDIKLNINTENTNYCNNALSVNKLQDTKSKLFIYTQKHL